MQECNTISPIHDKLLLVWLFTFVLQWQCGQPLQSGAGGKSISILKTILKPRVFIWLLISTSYSETTQQLTLLATIVSQQDIPWVLCPTIEPIQLLGALQFEQSELAPVFKTQEKYMLSVHGQNYCVLVSLIIRKGCILLFLRAVRKGKNTGKLHKKINMHFKVKSLLDLFITLWNFPFYFHI